MTTKDNQKPVNVTYAGGSIILVLIIITLFSNYQFQPFGFERTWSRLFQKHVVGTKFDIYVLLQ